MSIFFGFGLLYEQPARVLCLLSSDTDRNANLNHSIHLMEVVSVQHRCHSHWHSHISKGIGGAKLRQGPSIGSATPKLMYPIQYSSVLVLRSESKSSADFHHCHSPIDLVAQTDPSIACLRLYDSTRAGDRSPHRVHRMLFVHHLVLCSCQ